MPSVEQILSEHELDRQAWRFYRRSDGVGCGYAGRLGSGGYRRVYLCLFDWAEHRLIWKVVTGQEPRGLVDHINGVRDDNRFENLRDVSPSVNAVNRHAKLWEGIEAERAAARAEDRRIERIQRAARVEAKERALFAKLKSKYEV